VKPAAKKAGVPWAGPKTLRHTAATLLFRDGWNPKQVQKFMGHHSAAFTLATYVHLLPDDMPEPTVITAVIGGLAGATGHTETDRKAELVVAAV
jgi:integrase